MRYLPERPSRSDAPRGEDHLSQSATSTGITLQDRVRAVTASPIALAPYLSIDGPNGPVPFELWPCQVEALRVCRRYRRVSILKARQLGITWTVASLLGLWECIAFPTGETLVISIKDDDAQAVIERARTLYDSAPDWLQATFPRVVDNTDQISIQHPEGLSSLVSQSSSGKAGRSRTYRRVIGDERAFWEHAERRLAALKPAQADIGSLVELSTANGFNGHYDTWMGAVEPGQDPAMGNGYVRLFFGALAHPDRTLEWVMRERAGLGDLGPQEYPLTPEEAFLSTGRCAFDLSALAWYGEHSTSPAVWRGTLMRDASFVHGQPDDHGDWWIWEWPQAGRDYLIVADTSGGHGADYSAAAVIDMASWDQVAAYHARVEPHVLAGELVKAGILFNGTGGPALLVPEANNHGQGVIALLREWNYPRLYRTETLDREGKPTTTYGWTTTEKSRHLAVSSLQRGVVQQTLGIRDPAAIAEMRRFIWAVVNEKTGSGRYQAEEGRNDDRVMAWAIAAAVLAHAEAATPRPKEEPTVPYEPRVSSVTGY